MHNVKFIRRRFPRSQRRILGALALISGVALLVGLVLQTLW